MPCSKNPALYDPQIGLLFQSLITEIGERRSAPLLYNEAMTLRTTFYSYLKAIEENPPLDLSGHTLDKKFLTNEDKAIINEARIKVREKTNLFRSLYEIKIATLDGSPMPSRKLLEHWKATGAKFTLLFALRQGTPENPNNISNVLTAMLAKAPPPPSWAEIAGITKPSNSAQPTASVAPAETTPDIYDILWKGPKPSDKTD